MKDRENVPARGPESGPTPHATGLEALRWAVNARSAAAVVHAMRVHRQRRQRRRIAALLGGVAALALAAVFWRLSPARPSVPARPAASGVVSRPARQLLPDGTRVELRPGAEISVAFEPDLRRVVLRGGEAHFEVTKDAARPFVVVAGGVGLRAVGTAFAVQLSPGAVDILVTEGIVAVDRPPDPAGKGGEGVRGSDPLAVVPAGRRVVVETNSGAPVLQTPVAEVSDAERQERLAWRVPRLEFSGTPLSRAIPLFNEYSRVRLTFDPPLGKLQVSGNLRADDAESLLLLLRNEFNISAEPRAGGEIFLRR